MNVHLIERAVAYARRHETTADLALALGILLISVTDALAEQPNPFPLVVFSVALSVPLVWRRRSPMRVFAALAASPARSGSPTSRCSPTPRCSSRSTPSPPTSRAAGPPWPRPCSGWAPCSPRRAGAPTSVQDVRRARRPHDRRRRPRHERAPAPRLPGLAGGARGRRRASAHRARDARHRRPQPQRDDRAGRRRGLRRRAIARAGDRGHAGRLGDRAPGARRDARPARRAARRPDEGDAAAAAGRCREIDVLVDQVRAAGLPVARSRSKATCASFPPERS